MPDPETVLVNKAIDGDAAALTELLDRHSESVRASLHGQLPARWQSLLSADDVLQETYVDAFLDIRAFRPQGEGAFPAWLHTLAKRNLLDAVRMLEADKRGGHRIAVQPGGDTSLDALLDSLTHSQSTPSGVAARREAGDLLRRAIAALPAAYRQVIQSYDLDGRPIDEVAAALQRSPGATHLLRLRAHRRLREILGSASRFFSGSA